MKTMEERLLEQIADTAAENLQLKTELEITQAVVDEIMLGGADSGLQ